jgi:membrane protease YdiL (CAAX protease family)
VGFGPEKFQATLSRFVVGSFIVELILAESWLRIAHQSSITKLLTFHRFPYTLALGLGLAIVIALLSRAFFTRFTPQLIHELFVPIFSRVSNSNLLLISLLPGLGEEILFRGVLQAEVGLIGASLIFGFLHSGFSRRLLPYGLWATLVGFLLGLLYLFTGSIWGSIATHAIVNALGVIWIKRLA